MVIRPEEDKDRGSVHAVNCAAFDRLAEADLVDALRDQADSVVSLVAEVGGTVVGHILFSPVTLDCDAALRIAGLAPMAVLPDHQGQGVGSELVRAGLARCKEAGYGACVVLGHAAFYPRFGFVPSTRFGIKSEYDVPEDVFLALELEPGYLKGKSGVVQFHAAFRDV